MTGRSAEGNAAPQGGIALDLPVTADAVEQVQLAVSAYLAGFGLDELVLHRIEVILEELVSNVVRHAREATVLWLAAECHGGTTRICIEDNGPAFDPLAQPEPAPYKTLADAIPGGQGIPLVKRLAREVAYSRTKGRNRVCVTVAANRE